LIIFSEEQLHVVGVDYLFPASTTVTATLNFAMAFLINYPDVQTKMQEELDDVVGRDRLPTLDDRMRSVNGDALPISIQLKNMNSACEINLWYIL
jgi:cytochrome P450